MAQNSKVKKICVFSRSMSITIIRNRDDGVYIEHEYKRPTLASRDRIENIAYKYQTSIVLTELHSPSIFIRTDRPLA